MPIEYIVEDWDGDENDVPRVMDLFDRAIDLNYSGKLIVQKFSKNSSVKIAPQFNEIVGIHLRDTDEGRLARITDFSFSNSRPSNHARISIDGINYHVFSRNIRPSQPST